MVKVFFSYSHRDEVLRNELEIHLSSLKRQGIIDTWHDRRIIAGDEVHGEISEHLEQADIILLLVSPYFIASDYCYDVEMKRAMERHYRGETRVIPVILHPCDWQSTPFGSLLAVPSDGKPVSKFPNQHDAFLEITTAIRRAIHEMRLKSVQSPESIVSPRSTPDGGMPFPDIRSSNLRIKKKFNDQEKDRFLVEAFEYVAKFFEGSLAELKKRNPGMDADFRRIDANHFTAVVYVHGSAVNRCKIWLGQGSVFPSGIAYSTGDSSGDNSYNECMGIEDDGYSLFLAPLMGSAFRAGGERQMNYEGGAEYLWSMFIERLQT